MSRPSTHDGSYKMRNDSFLDSRGSLSATKLWTRPFTSASEMGFTNPRAASPVYRFKGGVSTFSKSSYPEEKKRGADVGTYDITRFADNNYVNKKDAKVMSRHLSASFRSSGRSKSLLHDGEHYLTMGNELKHSNLGPGSYDTLDTWASEERQTSSFVSTRPLKCLSSEYRKYAQETMDETRPWRHPPPLVHRKPLPGISRSTGTVESSEEFTREREMEIFAVQSLPPYR